MTSSRPSILLVGVGRWGENHLRVLLKLHAEGVCNLVGVHDIDDDRLQYIGKEFGVRTFRGDEGLSQADAVDIAVPTYSHLEVAKRMLQAGKDVLVEKPLTETVEEALELERICASSSRLLMVGHLFRYNAALEHVRTLLVDKAIGTLRFLRGRFMGFRFKERDAGVLATTAIHFIYVSNYLLGKPPKAVWARADYLLDSELDDYCMIRLDYGSEFCVIESDYFTPGKWRTFDIIGTQGAIHVDALNQTVDLHQKKHVYTGDRFEAYDGSILRPNIEFQEPLYHELKHFIECVRDRTAPLTGIADGVNALRIIEAAYQSSRSDKTIRLDL